MQGRNLETEVDQSDFWDNLGVSSIDQSYGDTESDMYLITEPVSDSDQNSCISTPDQDSISEVVHQDSISEVVHKTTWEEKYQAYLKDLRDLSDISADVSSLNEHDIYPGLSETTRLGPNDLPDHLTPQVDPQSFNSYSESSISSNPSESLFFIADEFRMTDSTNAKTPESFTDANQYCTKVSRRNSLSFVSKDFSRAANHETPKIINTCITEMRNINIPEVISHTHKLSDVNRTYTSNIDQTLTANFDTLKRICTNIPKITHKSTQQSICTQEPNNVNTEIPNINSDTRRIRESDTHKFSETENLIQIDHKFSELPENHIEVPIVDSQSSIMIDERGPKSLQKINTEPLGIHIVKEPLINPKSMHSFRKNKSESQLIQSKELQIDQLNQKDMMSVEYNRTNMLRVKEGNPISFIQGIHSFQNLKLKTHKEVWKLPFMHRLFSCCSFAKDMPENIREIVGRLIAFSKVHFSLANSFHRDLLDAVLQKCGFDRSQEIDIAQPIVGLTKNEDTELPLQIALSYPSSPLCLLFLLFLQEYFPGAMLKISMKHPVLLVLLSVSQCFIDLLSHNYANQCLDVQDQALERCFFLFAGIVFKWIEIYEETKASWNSRYKVNKKLMDYTKANILKMLVQAGEVYTSNNS